MKDLLFTTRCPRNSFVGQNVRLAQPLDRGERLLRNDSIDRIDRVRSAGTVRSRGRRVGSKHGRFITEWCKQNANLRWPLHQRKGLALPRRVGPNSDIRSHLTHRRDDLGGQHFPVEAM